MKRFIACLLIIAIALSLCHASAFAENTAVHGKITPTTILASILSFFLWPGIGQAMNHNDAKKVIAHILLGFTGIFRLWSGWDALIDRQGGRWNGLI